MSESHHPFIMVVEGVLPFSHPRVGQVVTLWGRIVSAGHLRKGDPVIIEGRGKRTETHLAGFIHIRYENPFDRPPDRIDLFIPHVPDGEIEPGMFLIGPETHLTDTHTSA